MKRNFNTKGYEKEYEELLDRLEKSIISAPQHSAPLTQSNPATPVNIIPNTDSWLIENNEYKIQLSKSLIPSATQEKQINNYITSTNSFKPANYQELFLIGNILYQNKNTEILNFLRESFKNNWIQTSSGVLYSPDKNDIVIHDKGLSSEQSLETKFIGPDRYIEKNDESALKCLTGLNNIDEIKEISQFLTDKNKTYLWRLNNKPSSDTYRVAWFSAVSDRAYLLCDRYPTDSNPALGVCVAKKI
ncbi:MAG: hypothetical protein KJ623_03185 [Nanoarchaeota archaeon]|nr:hypothetical protein [Nanoarchaeota archaeon]